MVTLSRRIFLAAALLLAAFAGSAQRPAAAEDRFITIASTTSTQDSGLFEYLLPIFTDAIGEEDMESVRHTLFAAGNLTQPYHSVNTDINKRIRYLDPEAIK